MFCYTAVSKLKSMLGYDDSLDVFGVHCVGSATGLLLVGLFASADVNPAIGNTFTVGGKAVSLAGSPAQLGNQFHRPDLHHGFRRRGHLLSSSKSSMRWPACA